MARSDRRPAPETLAAVDLGSNSFHLVVARVVDGVPRVIDRLRERVALAAGLDEDDDLTEEAQERALACVERFGQRLRTFGTAEVRAVGTNALRKAQNARAFLRRAASALGHPIEVISGHEEARLIYQGVAHDLTGDPERRLVIDIGGGSTECIVGQGFQVLHVDSLFMGSVSYSLEYFPKGEIKKSHFADAVMAARLEIEPIERTYRGLRWRHAVGSSGTMLAVEELLRENGWGQGGITPKGLARLKEAILDARRISDLKLRGLKEDRAPVLPGGVAILKALFDGFHIARLTVSQGALREGLLYDLLGRRRHEDVREESIREMAERYRVEAAYASAVERTAQALFDQVARAWDLSEDDARLLAWAARLHEIGIALSYTGYHKHSAYLVANSDLRGFARQEQQRLAALIRNHRRRLSEEPLDDLPGSLAQSTLRLSLLLRLAVRLNRARSPRAALAPRTQAKDRSLSLAFPRGFLDHRPMTRADLEEEAAYFDEAGYTLAFR